MTYSIRQAAKAAGRSKATIHRAVNIGKISAAKDEATGEWRIEPAELHRVFPPVSQGHVPDSSVKQREAIGDTSETAILRVLLEREREERQRERADKDTVIADLREDRDRWRTQAEKLLLTDQRAKAPDVIAMPSPTPLPHVSPSPTSNIPPAAAPTAPVAVVTPAPAGKAHVVKVRKPPPKEETSWLRKLIGGK